MKGHRRYVGEEELHFDFGIDLSKYNEDEYFRLKRAFVLVSANSSETDQLSQPIFKLASIVLSLLEFRFDPDDQV